GLAQKPQDAQALPDRSPGSVPPAGDQGMVRGHGDMPPIRGANGRGDLVEHAVASGLRLVVQPPLRVEHDESCAGTDIDHDGPRLARLRGHVDRGSALAEGAQQVRLVAQATEALLAGHQPPVVVPRHERAAHGIPTGRLARHDAYLAQEPQAVLAERRMTRLANAFRIYVVAEEEDRDGRRSRPGGPTLDLEGQLRSDRAPPGERLPRVAHEEDDRIHGIGFDPERTRTFGAGRRRGARDRQRHARVRERGSGGSAERDARTHGTGILSSRRAAAGSAAGPSSPAGSRTPTRLPTNTPAAAPITPPA